MTELTATGTLTRFLLRRDRVRVLVWIASIVLLELLSAASVNGIYTTQHDLDEAAAASHDNAAAIALNGPDQALDTLGGQVAFQIGTFGLVMVALMSTFMIGRATRGEEESGRLEVVRSMAVGRYAPTAAALIVVTGMNIAVGGFIAVGLLALDLPAAGSVVFGVSLTVLGLVFAAIATVAAQVTENTRVVHGATGAVLGGAFVLRAAGDIGDGTLSWLSPLGWAQKTRPFAGERWWPLLVSAGFVVALVWLAGLLAARRDEGAGLVHPRRGRPAAAPALGRPLGLALRLQRGSLIGWSIALFLTGISIGWVADDVEDLVGDNETVREMIATGTGGAGLTDSYLSQELLIVALIATGFTLQSALRLRGEESALRTEAVLATRVSRGRWVASHLAVAMGGSVIVLAAAGLGTGLMYGLVSHDLGQVPRLLGAALAHAPALWLLAGLAIALYGLLPRGMPAVWAVLGFFLVVGMLGEVLDLPSWVTGLSAFQHTPRLPAADAALLPLAALTALAAGLAGAGLAAFRRRDVA